MNTKKKSPTLFPEEEVTPDLREIIMETHDFIKQLKNDYDQYISDLRLDRRTVEELLGVSTSTVARWRRDGVLPYTITPSGMTTYLFEDVLAAVKRGVLTSKSFSQMEAICRLKAFKTGVLFRALTNINLNDEDNEQ